MIKKIIISILIYIIHSGNLFAKENIISGKVRTEIYAINNYDSNVRQKEFREYYNKTKLSLKANLKNNLSLSSVLKLSEMNQALENLKRDRSVVDSGTRSFENHGAYVEKLFFKYQINSFNFFAGKNTLNFGKAWKRDNYIWILNKASKYYRFNEKIAFGGSIKGGKSTNDGQYILTYGSYFNDNKYLDNSIFTRRDYNDNYTTNVGNDKSLFSSYYSALDIDYDFGNKEVLKYHFGYIKSSINKRKDTIERQKISDQKSYVANVNYQIPITENIIPKIFLEYAILNNYQGNNFKDTSLLTKYIMLNLKHNYYLTYTRSTVKYIEIGKNGKDEIVDEVSFGYKFNTNIFKGLSTYIGYSKEKIDKKTSKNKTKSTILYLKYENSF